VAAVLVGIAQNDVEEELEQTVASVDFQNGLLWYNENVVSPVIGMANEKLEASTQGSRAKQAAKAQLRSAKLLEKKSECFHTVAAYMGGESPFFRQSHLAVHDLALDDTTFCTRTNSLPRSRGFDIQVLPGTTSQA
jgi:hypothetical protein